MSLPTGLTTMVVSVTNCQVGFVFTNAFELQLLWSLFEQLVSNDDVP